MQKVESYEQALKVYLGLIPDYDNETYMGARNLFLKTTTEQLGKNEWKQRFIDHIVSSYV